MKEKGKSGRRWYPILAGIAVPLLGASLITAGFFALLQAFGTDPTSLGVFPMLMTDIVKIILAAVIILIMKRISHGSFTSDSAQKISERALRLPPLRWFCVVQCAGGSIFQWNIAGKWIGASGVGDKRPGSRVL